LPGVRAATFGLGGEQEPIEDGPTNSPESRIFADHRSLLQIRGFSICLTVTLILMTRASIPQRNM